MKTKMKYWKHEQGNSFIGAEEKHEQGNSFIGAEEKPGRDWLEITKDEYDQHVAPAVVPDVAPDEAKAEQTNDPEQGLTGS